MEGPTVNSIAPCGVFSRTQMPASRPPGSPPVPATKVPVVEGWITCQLGIRSDRATIPVVTALAHAVLKRQRRKRISAAGDQQARVRPAKRATAGAIGSKY